jgi:hypothetical protein
MFIKCEQYFAFWKTMFLRKYTSSLSHLHIGNLNRCLRPLMHHLLHPLTPVISCLDCQSSSLCQTSGGHEVVEPSLDASAHCLLALADPDTGVVVLLQER